MKAVKSAGIRMRRRMVSQKRDTQRTDIKPQVSPSIAKPTGLRVVGNGIQRDVAICF